MREFEPTLYSLTPGKIILSGEHAVVYGSPAIAMALNCFLQIKASPLKNKKQLSVELQQFNQSYDFSEPQIKDCYDRLNQHYQEFSLGRLSINQVVVNPVELIVYCVGVLFEEYKLLIPSTTKNERLGIHLQIHSDIPLGCGMGSSAACIVGTLITLCRWFDIDADSQTIYRLAQQIENLQHGQSSGIDVRLAQTGGTLKFQKGESISLPLPKINFLLVNSGKPISSTGESVSFARNYFRKAAHITEFSIVTLALEQALYEDNRESIYTCIERNHELLVKLGVVSHQVQQFIQSVMKIGAAGKICGAGSVQGDACGGLLIAYHSNDLKLLQKIHDLCTEYRYTVMPVQGVTLGSHCVTTSAETTV